MGDAAQVDERQREAIVSQFRRLTQERESLASALVQRQQDVESHNLVIRTLEQQDPARRAWRLVGDVLIESAVAEVLPATRKNRDNLSALAQSLQKQLEAKSRDVLAFQTQYKIRFKKEGGGAVAPTAAAAAAAGPQGQGVLVSGSG